MKYKDKFLHRVKKPNQIKKVLKMITDDNYFQ